MNKDNEIFEYIRRRNGGKARKVGVILGTCKDGVIKIGWSKCNEKCGDTFDSHSGISIARDRIIGIDRRPSILTTPVPSCISSQVRQFSARCVRYFKGANKLEIPS